MQKSSLKALSIAINCLKQILESESKTPAKRVVKHEEAPKVEVQPKVEEKVREKREVSLRVFFENHKEMFAHYQQIADLYNKASHLKSKPVLITTLHNARELAIVDCYTSKKLLALARKNNINLWVDRGTYERSIRPLLTK